MVLPFEPDPAGDRNATLAPDGASRTETRVAVLLLILLAAISSARLFLPHLVRADLFEDDLQQHVWWTYRFADPELFPGDRTADFMSGPHFAPHGYRLLYCAFVPLVDAKTFASALPFVLAVPVVFFAYRLGALAGGGRSVLGSVAAATFAIFSAHLLPRVSGGLPRSFALPILLFGISSVIARQHLRLGIAFVLSALFYPPAVVNLGVFAAIVLAVRTVRERRLPERWPALVALGLAALAILVRVYAAPLPPDVGPKTTRADALAMPEFHKGGRSALFEDDPLRFYFRNERAGLGTGPRTLAALAALAALTAAVLPGAISFEAWALATSSLLAFVLAHATLFALHLPSRYVMYTLPLFLLLWIAGALPRLVDTLARASRARSILAVIRRPPVLGALTAAAVAAAAVPAAISLARTLGTPPPEGQEEAYAFLASLPKDTLVAAHPDDASAVPLRARRSVVASAELSLPYHLGHYRRLAERIADELAACFASRWEEVDRLYERYGADVFLVNATRYAEPRKRLYYEPFEAAAHAAFERGAREGFALVDPPEDRVLFRRGAFSVVRLGPLRSP